MGDSFTQRVTGLFHFLDNLDLIYEKQYEKPVKEIARRDKRKKGEKYIAIRLKAD